MTQSHPKSDDLHDRTDAAAHIAHAVRSRRRSLSLRQDELADLADCSTRFVHDVEHAKPTLRLDKVVAVLDTLGLQLEVTAAREPDATADHA